MLFKRYIVSLYFQLNIVTIVFLKNMNEHSPVFAKNPYYLNVPEVRINLNKTGTVFCFVLSVIWKQTVIGHHFT